MGEGFGEPGPLTWRRLQRRSDLHRNDLRESTSCPAGSHGGSGTPWVSAAPGGTRLPERRGLEPPL